MPRHVGFAKDGAKERGLARIAFDKRNPMRIAKLLGANGNDQAGKSAAAAEISPMVDLAIDATHHLKRIPNMASPEISERGPRNQVDPWIPFFQKAGKDFQPVERFT